MFTVTIKLRYDGSAETDKTSRGWFLPSLDPATWLEALARIIESDEEFECYLAPSSHDVNEASGLIILPLEGRCDRKDRSRERKSPATHSRDRSPFVEAVPLVRFTDSAFESGSADLWIPDIARLDPEPSIERWEESVQNEPYIHYVWLPSCGLVGLEPLDRIDPVVLLLPPNSSRQPDERQFAWIKPPKQTINRDSIGSIQFPAPPDLFSEYAEEKSQIGGQAESLMDLRGPQESAWKSTFGRMFRSLLSKLASRKNKSPKPETNRPQKGRDEDRSSRTGSPQRAASQQSSDAAAAGANGLGWSRLFSGALQRERERQIEKLLAYFAVNPDMALRFAIPMAQAAMRGLAAAGSALSARTPDFSMPNLFGGGEAGDPWHLPQPLQERLLAAYREQADREVMAGRYRRAAYIYAHLLGDLQSAARVLEQGGFYAEAAAMYGEVLHRPYDQARCLMMVGRFAEAADVYEHIQDYTAAAKLWEKIGEPDKARSAYQRAVDHLIARREIIQAVELLDSKLDSRKDAEQLLWSMWPHGAQAVECARRGFKWLGESGMHDAAHQRLEQVVRDAREPHPVALATLSLHLTREYPEIALRRSAEDACRGAVSSALTRANGSADDCLALLRSLHPSDKVLRRDLRRFAERQRVNEIKLQPIEKGEGDARLKREHQVLRLRGEEFYDAVMVGTSLVAIGWHGGQLSVCRTVEYGTIWSTDPVPLMEMPRAEAADVHCAVMTELHRTDLYIGLRERPLSFPERVIQTDGVGQSTMRVRPLSCTSTGSFTVTAGGVLYWIDPELTALHSIQDGLQESTKLHGALLEAFSDWMVSGDSPVSGSEKVAMASIGLRVYFSVGRALFVFADGRINTIRSFPSEVLSICPSLPHTLPRLLITTDHDSWVVSLKGTDAELVAREEEMRQAVFLHGGRLAVLTYNELQLYQRDRKAYRLRASQPIPPGVPIKLLSMKADVIGLLYADGRVERWSHR